LLDEELGIVVSPTTGAVKVGLDIKGLDDISTDVAGSDRIPIYDVTAEQNKYVTVQNLTNAHQTATTFSGTLDAYGSITHGLNSFDVIVQLYDETTFKTIYMEVERDTVNTVTLSGSGTFPGDVKVLVTKVV